MYASSCSYAMDVIVICMQSSLCHDVVEYKRACFSAFFVFVYLFIHVFIYFLSSIYIGVGRFRILGGPRFRILGGGQGGGGKFPAGT